MDELANAVLATLDSAQPVEIQRLATGADADMWKVQTESGIRALRLLRPDQRDQAAQEIAMSAWCAQLGGPVRVPKVLAETTFDHRPAYLMEWIEGETLFDAFLANPDRIPELSMQFGAMQAQIHRMPVPRFLPDFRDTYRATIGAVKLHELLAELCATEQAIIHLDYHPLNVMTRNGKITAVLDWANASIGHPALDLARTLGILELLPNRDLAFVNDVRDAWMDGYREVAGTVLIPDCALWWSGELLKLEWRPRIGTRPGIDEAFLGRIEAWTNRFATE